MSGGGFRGQSFGSHGGYYNNLRLGGFDNEEECRGRGGRSRDENNRNNKNYSHENFKNSIPLGRDGHSQNENSSGRRYSRWDEPPNIPLLPSPPIWSQNRGGHYQNGSMRFQHRNNDSQQYFNHVGRGHFPRGGYRFSSPRGSHNFYGPYYSAPFRESTYEQHEKEIPLEEPAMPLLGSEEERQQKITEAADELKRKLQSTSIINDDTSCWEDDDTLSTLPRHSDESNVIKPIPELKHGPPELDLTPNDLKDIGKLNNKSTIDPIMLFDDIQVDRKNKSIVETSVCDNTPNNDSVNTNTNKIPIMQIDMNNDDDKITEIQITEINYTVETLNDSVDSAFHNTKNNFNELSTGCITPTIPIVAIENLTKIDESRQASSIGEISSVIPVVVDTSDIIENVNKKVPDSTITVKSTTELSSTTDNNRMTMDIDDENKTQDVPFLSSSAVQNSSKKEEINPIEFLEEQTALSRNKSSLVNETEDTCEINNEQEKSVNLVSSSLHHDQNKNSECSKKITGTINHNYSESEILQPPPLPPTLPSPSYESPKLCSNTIVPDFDPSRCPSHISSPYSNTFQQSTSYDIHIPGIKPIMPTELAVNPSTNMTASIPNYAMSHQNYISTNHYDPGISLSYSPVISGFDFLSTQSIPLPPPPLSNSSSAHSLISEDVCAPNTNDDDDVLGDLRRAMEFAKQCMVMENNDNETEEENIEFPTFPDLPPVVPMATPPNKLKSSKKNFKSKKVKQQIKFGPHAQTIVEKKSESTEIGIEKKILPCKTDEISPDESNRRKVMFNLNSKIRVLNKKDDLWADESTEEEKKERQKKWRLISLISDDRKCINKPEETKRNVQSENTKESEKITPCEKSKGLECTSRHVDTDENNKFHKNMDSSQAKEKDRREIKKKIEKTPESSVSNKITIKDSHVNPMKSQKLEKTTDDGDNTINGKKNTTKNPLLLSKKSSTKTIMPKSINESSWKDRVIGRFLKMSKNDIQNMINNSSLRKFDIAMQHLVKEKKSSLSLEMRNQEDEKMKISTYNNEDFMNQLQAILDPAATIDITNLPTNFIHQLSEVLHLDPSPVVDISSNTSNDKKGEFPMLSTHVQSSPTKIDSKMTSETSQCIGTSTPVISTHDTPKSRKIDNRVSKDFIKNTQCKVLEDTTCAHSKGKRGQNNNANIQRKKNEVTTNSASSGNINNVNVNKLNDSNEPSTLLEETIKISPIINFKITTTPSAINQPPITERILPVVTTSPIISKVETTTRVARQSPEFDTSFLTGKSKTASSSSMPISATDSTIDESCDTRVSRSLHHGAVTDDHIETPWRRKVIDNTDSFRNMTKEEHESRHGELISHAFYEEGNEKITTAPSRKISINCREVSSYPMHIDRLSSPGFHTPPLISMENSLIQTGNNGAGSDSTYDSDSSSANSSTSDSESESTLIDVSKVLKFIKEREKMAKKKTLNEEMRDEVAAEIERCRRERSTKHKSHKSRSKKRDKRKKEKKDKRKKSKKKRRHKSHHLPHSSSNTVEKKEFPLRLLNDKEIKREPLQEEPLKTTQEITRKIEQPEQLISSTKISPTVVTSALANKLASAELIAATSLDPPTNISTQIMSDIDPSSIPLSSTFKNNLIRNSRSLIVTVMNTSVANTDASVSRVVKTALPPTTTTPIRTVTAVTSPCRTTVQSPIPQPKTKAQLKQMPEIIKKIQNNNLKIIESVSSTSENQIINPEPPTTLLLLNTSSTSTVNVSSQSGSKKLDIKTYQERALQRKYKDQEKMRNFVENPSNLTENLLMLPIKKKYSSDRNSSSFIDNQSQTSETGATTNIVNQPNNTVTTSESPTVVTSQAKKAKHNQVKVANVILPEKNHSKVVKSSARQTLNQVSTSDVPTTKLVTETVTVIDNKFVNIKSEGGKELKLKEKVKKRPYKQKIETPTPIDINTVTIQKVSPMMCDEQKNSLPSIEIDKNSKNETENVDNTEMPIESSLSVVNIATNDIKDNFKDNNPSESIETDAFNTVRKKNLINADELSLEVNHVATVDIQLPEKINPIKNSDQSSNNRSDTIEKELNVTVQNEISPFSHYFKFTKGLICDGLPDTIAREKIMLQSTTQVTAIIQNENTMKFDDIHVVSSDQKVEDEIKTSEQILEVNIPTITSKVTENILTSNNISEDFQDSDELLEVMVQPDVSDLLKDSYDEVQSSPSTPLITDKDAQSSSTSASVIIPRSQATTYKSTSTDLLDSGEFSNADTTISTTYEIMRVEDNIVHRSYDQLTLDDLSDISMDGSIVSDHQEISEVSTVNTNLLSKTQKNGKIVNSLEKDALLMAKENEDKLIATESDNDNWNNRDINNSENNDVIHEINQDQLPLDTEHTPDNISPSNNCYDEYSQREVILHDRVLSMEEPRNYFLDPPVTFSITKSPTPEPIEFSVLDGDNNVTAESIYDDPQLEKTSMTTTNDKFIEAEAVTNSIAQTSFDDSCTPPPPLTSIPSPSDNNDHDSSFHNKKLIKDIEQTSPERLPSPIFQVSSKSSENDKNDDNNTYDNIDGIDICDGSHSKNEVATCNAVVNPAINENIKCIEPSTLTNDSSSTNKLSNDSSELVIEFPTSTTRINETNSSTRNESDRSSSETRSIDQYKMQHEIFNSSISMKKNHSKHNRNSTSKNSNYSKSSTTILNHNKHKKHNRKKHKLTMKHIDEATNANIAILIPKPTTKVDVMSRMQEIDIAIQRLMNEKMTLYQMLQTDEWPIDRQDEKVKTHLSSDKKHKSSLVKESRIVMSRLTENENDKQFTITESTPTKSQITCFSKNATPKTSKSTVKSDDKHAKKLDETTIKLSNKRKHNHNEKESHKSKEIKRDSSFVAKKDSVLDETVHQKNKSSSQMKNLKSHHNKPVKLSQMLAREFKPKTSTEKYGSKSPTVDGELKVTQSPARHKIKPFLNNQEFLSEDESTDVLLNDDRRNIIYSDESSLDIADLSTEKHERSTGLSLLEESIKRDMEAKKVKPNESKNKTPSKSSRDISTPSTDLDTESISPSKLISKKKYHRKKYKHTVNKSPTKMNTHVLEIIDAVAKNCINDLYTNTKTPEKKLKGSKKNEKQMKINENELIMESETSGKMMTSTEKRKNQSAIVEEINPPPLSPQPISECANECNIEDNNTDENKLSTFDSVNYADKKHESSPNRRDDELKKIKLEAIKKKEASIEIMNNKENILQYSSPVEQQEDIKSNGNNVEIMSSTNSDAISNKESNKTLQARVLDDWQDSSDESKHEFNYLSEDIKNTTSTAIEKISNKTIFSHTASTTADSSTDEKNCTVPETKKCLMKNSTISTMMKSDELITLEENKNSSNDALIKKKIVKDSINERDDKLKKSKCVGKEIIERPKSTMPEFEKIKLSMREFERSRSTVEELENLESPDDNYDDDKDDDIIYKKRGRIPKRRKQSSSRKNSRQSEDSFKSTSRSRSQSKRITKSPNSRDTSTPDIERKARSASRSSSTSNNSRRRSNTTSHTDTKISAKASSIRKSRKRINSTERTREEMANCKVRLVDCKNLLSQSELRSDILHRLGISRINTWTLASNREATPERSPSKLSSVTVDDDKNRSDDDSMEMIQVDENLDLQNLMSPESSADIIMRDPLTTTPQLSPIYNSSPPNEDTKTTLNIESQNKTDTVSAIDHIEVLETRTLSTPMTDSAEKNEDSELQMMQYTVHKGPILDIKVFGDSFLAASEDGAIYRYCQRSNGILNIYKGHDAAVTCLYIHEIPGTAVSGNTRWNLFSGSLDATLRCYDIMNGSLERHVADVGSPIQCMDQAWGMIFVGTKSGHISRYDIKSGCLREDNLDFSDKPVLALRASTEGARRVLIVASRNQPITIRDAQNGLYLRTISGQRNHTVYSLMRDRNLVYCGTSSTSIPVFDFITGEQVIQYTAGVGIVCMQLYRQLLFAGCYDGNIYVFDTKDTRLICSIPGPGNMLLSMEIVDDKIIAGSKDRRLHAWRMPNQARLILAERT